MNAGTKLNWQQFMGRLGQAPIGTTYVKVKVILLVVLQALLTIIDNTNISLFVPVKSSCRAAL
jgi:hypothetical protein